MTGPDPRKRLALVVGTLFLAGLAGTVGLRADSEPGALDATRGQKERAQAEAQARVQRPPDRVPASGPVDVAPSEDPGAPALSDAPAEDGLAGRLGALADTYLGDHPDHAGMLNLLKELAADASFDSGSITRENDVVRGLFTTSETGLDGQLLLQPSGCSVHLTLGAGSHAAQGVLARTVSLGFQPMAGSTTGEFLTVMAILDPDPADVVFPSRGELPTGWTLRFRDGSGQAVPTSASPSPQGGPAKPRRGLEQQAFQARVDTTAHAAWFSVLGPYLP